MSEAVAAPPSRPASPFAPASSSSGADGVADRPASAVDPPAPAVNGTDAAAPPDAVDPSHVQGALNAVVHSSLLPITGGLSALYLIYVITHVVLLPMPQAAYVSLLSAASSVLLLVLRMLLPMVKPRSRHVHALGGLVAGVVLAHALLYEYVAGGVQIVETALILVGIGFVFMSTRWFLAVVAVSLVGWATVALQAHPPSDIALAGVSLLATAALASVMHTVRRQTNAKAERLRLATDQQRAALQRAWKTENEHRRSLAQSQAALEDALRDAEHSMHRWRALVRNHPGGVLISRNGRIAFANDAAASILGADAPRTIEGLTLSSLAHPDIRTILRDRERRESTTQVPPLEFELTGLDREKRAVVTRSVPIVYDDAPAAQVVLQDVTERKRRMEELRTAKEEAVQANQLKSAFLANMSHEIRTPLTSIIGFSDVLSDATADEVERFSTLIRRSSHRLLETINSVLDLSKLEAGAMRLSPTQIDVAAEVSETADVLAGRAEQDGVDLRVDVPSRHVTAKLDASGLHRILNNLVGNAIKFTDTGGRVDLRLTTTPDALHIEVEDTGIGIDADFLPDLFESFKQESTGKTRSHEGSGLGLAITKRLVTLMEGTIEVESTKGVGTCFTVRLPRRPDGGDDRSRPSDRPRLRPSITPPASSDLPDPSDPEADGVPDTTTE